MGDDRINRPSSIMENWCRRWSNRVSAQCKTQLLTFMINKISINTALLLPAPKLSSLNLRRVYCHWIISYFGGWGNLQLHYHLSWAGKKGLEALYTSKGSSACYIIRLNMRRLQDASKPTTYCRLVMPPKAHIDTGTIGKLSMCMRCLIIYTKVWYIDAPIWIQQRKQPAGAKWSTAAHPAPA